MSEKIVFEKRIEKWNSYRNEILNESIKSDYWFKDNKTIKNIIDRVNEIDPLILKDFDYQKNLKLLGSSIIEENNTNSLEQTYKSLKFNIPSLNDQFLENINEEIIKNENIRNYRCFLDKDTNELIEDKLVLYSKYNNDELEITNQINDVEQEIQNFPSTANEKLKTLHKTIVESKKNKMNNFFSIKNNHIEKSFDFKITYFCIFSILIFLILAAILCIILWAIL